MTKDKRMVSVDLLRIAMAIQVFLFHMAVNPIAKCTFGVLTSFFKMGAIAMTGFFMVSGYCLYRKYCYNDMEDIVVVRRFYLQRMASILPTYLVVIIVYKIWDQSSVLEKIVLLPVEFVGIQSHFTSLFSVSHFSGTWFISCMLICYFLFPLFHMLVSKSDIKTLLFVGIGIICLLVYAPVVCWFYKTEMIYTKPIFRVMEFVLGMMLANLEGKCKYNLDNVRRGICYSFILFIYIFGISFMYNREIAQGNYMFYGFFEILFVIGYIFLWRDYTYPNIICVLSEKLSKITYGFYMANMLCGFFLVPLISQYELSNFSKIALFFMVNLGVAMALYFFIERPLGNWMRKRLVIK